MSLVVYSWSNILAKKVATSSAGGLSFIGLPNEIQIETNPIVVLTEQN